MLKFFKKKTKESKPKEKEIKTKKEVIAEENIHTIPQRFYIAPKKGMSKKIKIILISVMAGLVIIGGIIFFSIDWSAKFAQQPSAQPDLNVGPVINENENLNEPVNEAEMININEIEEVEEVEELEEEEEEEEEPEEERIPRATPLPSSSDSDQDGLTDLEEELYQTDKNKPDTDIDGYLDGAEVRNGYNPLLIGSKLETSDLVKIYPSSVYRYTLLYPSSWQINSLDETGQQIIFLSATKEYVEIIAQENTKNQSLKEWYLDLVDIGTPAIQELNDWQVIRSSDEQTIYLTQDKGNYIYIITYDSGELTELNFKATFEMMIKSFSLVQEE